MDASVGGKDSAKAAVQTGIRRLRLASWDQTDTRNEGAWLTVYFMEAWFSNTYKRCDPNMVFGQKTVELVEGQKGAISKFCSYEKC